MGATTANGNDSRESGFTVIQPPAGEANIAEREPETYDSAGEGAPSKPGRLFAKMPQLSDRCGGSRDDSVMVPIPEGMNLPEGVVVRLDDGQ